MHFLQRSYYYGIYINYNINKTIQAQKLLHLSTILIYRFAFLIILFSILLFYDPLSSDYLYSFLVPVMIYDNAETEKSKILSDNRCKATIYQRRHKQSGKIYIGSAADLSKRMSSYYSTAKLKT